MVVAMLFWNQFWNMSKGAMEICMSHIERHSINCNNGEKRYSFEYMHGKAREGVADAKSQQDLQI